MINIIRKIITKNFTKGRNKVNKYIVIHYTTDLKSKPGQAEANRNYFNTTNNEASAHYIVDDKYIIQAVEDFDTAWHCGAKTYKHPHCRNSNSIGIEMCSSNSSGKPYKQCYATDLDWYFTEEVENNTIELTAYLMEKYNIPIENVIRHYDVTGKICPSPYVQQKGEWDRFKNKLNKYIEDKEDENMTNETFKKLFDEMRKELQDNDSGTWSKEAREWATEEGLINGNGTQINGEPNCMWQDFLTREQFAAVLYKFYKMIK